MDGATIKLEAPMRPASLRFEPCAILWGKIERGAIVDRRLVECAGALAATIKLVLGLVAGIEPASGYQPVARCVIKRGPLRLAHEQIGRDAEPGQVRLDAIGKLAGRADMIGVVHAQDIATVMATGIEPVEQGRPGIAQMDTASGGRRPANSGHPGVRSL